MIKSIKKNILYIAWIQAIVAMLGSLYFSEVLRLPPCILCWYQRILLYPQVVIIAVGIIRKDKNLPYFVLPFTILGILVASYQYLLQKGIVPESSAPCTLGISCTTKYIELFGFMTIPFLSLMTFIVISICMWIFLKDTKRS